MSSPPALPGLHAGETPIDRALTLRLAGETETALRWAAAALQAEPELPSALLLVAELLAELGRREPAREGLEICVARAIDAGLLPLAVAACVALKKLGVDAAKSFDAVADAFHARSERLDEDGHVAPPPPPKGGDLQPLSSLIMGPALLNKAVEILRQAVAPMREAMRDSSPSPMVPRLPLFSELSRKGLRLLIEAFEVRVAPAGGMLIEEGSPGTEAFIVARGDLEVRRTGSEGEPVVLARLQNGQVFGEMALVSRSPRAASVVATRPSLVLAAPVEALEAVAARAPEVGEQLATFCRERMLQNLVRTSPILGAVDPAERGDLVSRFETRTFEEGEMLIRKGETHSGLHLIASGKVEVIAEEAGERLVIASLGAGDVVGEVAMILRRAANANVVAVHPTVTLHLAGSVFQEVLRAHPSLLAQLYELAVKRDEETTSVIAQEATSADDYVLV
ncbi:MAG: cyclic nucleotide-binding domain-containing protein [Deltaproteobacteria bacterium]|nr:cyclic nucleotide-binding domain-containing protein [Deltaproteobacteria bacterium]